MFSSIHRNSILTNIRHDRLLANPLLWITFIVYLILAGYTIANHEMWGDEIHSWNIAKGSNSFLDMVSNCRYEGHPPAWYVILWVISKFTHELAYVQAVHLVIASLSIFLILFFSPLPFISRLLVPFGYFFLFEYAVISRNYAIGVLLAICICLIIRRNFRYKTLFYYILIFLLSNTHLQAIMLAASLHLYFLLFTYEQTKRKRTIIIHALLGILIAIPALYFIFPPSDSQLNTGFWMDRWNIHRVTAFIQGPLRAFLPVPAWWNYHSWNTQFLVEAKESYSIFRFINLFIAIVLVAVVIFILKRNKKSLALFSMNLLLNFIIAVTVITLTAGRHAGFIYIGFIISYCLYCYETPVTTWIKRLVNGLLIIQLTGGVFAAVKDIRHPFSNSCKVNELLAKIPAGEKIITDYWTLDAVAAFADKPFYCIEMQKEISFVVWNRELGEVLKKRSRYIEGINNLFQKEGINKVYMLSIGLTETLLKADQQLATSYHVILIDKREGAMEKSSNLYLYRISMYPPDELQ
jgi:hypothetical protein